MNVKRYFLFFLTALLLCLPVWAMAAQNISIGDGETVTLSETLSQGCDIVVDGNATLVLDR